MLFMLNEDVTLFKGDGAYSVKIGIHVKYGYPVTCSKVTCADRIAVSCSVRKKNKPMAVSKYNPKFCVVF